MNEMTSPTADGISNNHDRFARTRLILGETGMARLHSSLVAVIGLGAVGGYAVEALTRSGVGSLRLIDFDEIRDSNFNRQILATESTLGIPKVMAAESRVASINPSCRVEALRSFAHRDTVSEILAGPPDFVIDAIDSLNPKVELISALLDLKIPFISSMGAALRTDPSKIRIGPARSVRYCPLARQVRKLLKRRGYCLDFPCVHSTEPVRGPRGDRPPAWMDAGDASETSDRGRPRNTLGSLPTLTGIFGLTAANFVICSLSGMAGFDKGVRQTP